MQSAARARASTRRGDGLAGGIATAPHRWHRDARHRRRVQQHRRCLGAEVWSTRSPATTTANEPAEPARNARPGRPDARGQTGPERALVSEPAAEPAPTHQTHTIAPRTRFSPTEKPRSAAASRSRSASTISISAPGRKYNRHAQDRRHHAQIQRGHPHPLYPNDDRDRQEPETRTSTTSAADDRRLPPQRRGRPPQPLRASSTIRKVVAGSADHQEADLAGMTKVRLPQVRSGRAWPRRLVGSQARGHGCMARGASTPRRTRPGPAARRQAFGSRGPSDQAAAPPAGARGVHGPGRSAWRGR